MYKFAKPPSFFIHHFPFRLFYFLFLFRAQEKRVARGRVTEVDDAFFKLRDMEQFLEQEDRREERRQNRRDEDEDEEEIDLFDEVGEDEEDTGAMYSQVFPGEEGEAEGGARGQGAEGEEEEQQQEEDEEDGDDDTETNKFKVRIITC